MSVPHIPLLEAHLCSDCDMLFTWRDNKEGCPACASNVSIPLSKIILPMEGKTSQGGNK